MSREIPTLGYPSRTAAVLALLSQGLEPREVGERIGISSSAVTSLAWYGQRSTKRSGRPAEKNARTVVFPVDLLERLRPHAEARGMTPNALARQIVDTVVDEGLVTAVLDDGEEAV